MFKRSQIKRAMSTNDIDPLYICKCTLCNNNYYSFNVSDYKIKICLICKCKKIF